MVSAPAISNLCGDAPQNIATTERRMTAMPTVTSTTDSTGSPSIGRITSRSATSPMSAPMTMAISTVSTAPVPQATDSDQVA